MGRYDQPCTWAVTDDDGTVRHCGAQPSIRYTNHRGCIDHQPHLVYPGKPAPVKPDPERTLAGLRRRARIADAAPPMVASQLTDDRAVASGKRRASAHVVAEAKARLGIKPRDLPATETTAPDTEVPLFT